MTENQIPRFLKSPKGDAEAPINEYDRREVERAWERFMEIIDDLIMELHTTPEPDMQEDSEAWDQWYDEEYRKVWMIMFPHLPLPTDS